MGWWKQGDDLLGDGPVDIFEEEMARWSAASSKPTWQGFANAVAAAMGKVGIALSDGLPSPSTPMLQFHLANHSQVLTSSTNQADQALSNALADIFGKITEEYEEHRGRKPTATEVLGTISFSLGVKPERFLSGAEGTSLDRISLRPLT